MQIRTHSVRDLGLGTALAGVVSRFTARTGIDVSYTADETAAAFADARAEAVLRIAEEALRNIEQHAAATSVTVRLLDYEGGFIGLLVQDDGVGFDPLANHPGHYGLVGLREQAHLVGATLDIDSRSGEGTDLMLRWRAAPDLTS
jgi:nitrate/nitrite-specific signal transduction histidine kinase